MKRNYFKCKHEFGTGDSFRDEDIAFDIQVEMWFSDKEIPERCKDKICERLNETIGKCLEDAVEKFMYCDNIPDALGHLSKVPNEYPVFEEVERFGGEFETDIFLVDI